MGFHVTLGEGRFRVPNLDVLAYGGVATLLQNLHLCKLSCPDCGWQFVMSGGEEQQQKESHFG